METSVDNDALLRFHGLAVTAPGLATPPGCSPATTKAQPHGRRRLRGGDSSRLTTADDSGHEIDGSANGPTSH
jgi:hypothetical protein